MYTGPGQNSDSLLKKPGSWSIVPSRSIPSAGTESFGLCRRLFCHLFWWGFVTMAVASRPVLNGLTKWFEELEADFGSDVPPLNDVAEIVPAVERHCNVHLVKYIGSGTNGYVIVTDKQTVIKFTIDSAEAGLWAQ